MRQARDKIASYRVDLVELRLALGGLMLCCAALGLSSQSILPSSSLGRRKRKKEKNERQCSSTDWGQENERLVTIYH